MNKVAVYFKMNLCIYGGFSILVMSRRYHQPPLQDCVLVDKPLNLCDCETNRNSSHWYSALHVSWKTYYESSCCNTGEKSVSAWTETQGSYHGISHEKEVLCHVIPQSLKQTCMWKTRQVCAGWECDLGKPRLLEGQALPISPCKCRINIHLLIWWVGTAWARVWRWKGLVSEEAGGFISNPAGELI